MRTFSICGACYLGRQRHPELDCLCHIPELVHPGVPIAAVVALGTLPLIDPPLIHPEGTDHYAEVNIEFQRNSYQC
ncbi:hypothetical protein GOODEAATRI_015068 [Goodea atripinnis]|uniref:Uncharacterized protein n=1 Tax=Goodea atripinnis TaxID=208336 RepID=A0ABV0P4B1_9TELE